MADLEIPKVPVPADAAGQESLEDKDPEVEYVKKQFNLLLYRLRHIPRRGRRPAARPLRADADIGAVDRRDAPWAAVVRGPWQGPRGSRRVALHQAAGHDRVDRQLPSGQRVLGRRRERRRLHAVCGAARRHAGGGLRARGRELLRAVGQLRDQRLRRPRDLPADGARPGQEHRAAGGVAVRAGLSFSFKGKRGRPPSGARLR